MAFIIEDGVLIEYIREGSETKVVIPEGVTEILNRHHWGISPFGSSPSWLKSVELPKSLTSISSNAFARCTQLREIVIPEGVTEIGPCAFMSCKKLESITIPEGVTSIGYEAFGICTSLESITIPASVTSIGGIAFYNTKWLRDRQAEDPLVIVNGIVVDGQACKGKVVIPEGTTCIADQAFFKNQAIKEVEMPDSVTVIGQRAFEDCMKLTSIRESLIPVTGNVQALYAAKVHHTSCRSEKNLRECF